MSSYKKPQRQCSSSITINFFFTPFFQCVFLSLLLTNVSRSQFLSHYMVFVFQQKKNNKKRTLEWLFISTMYKCVVYCHGFLGQAKKYTLFKNIYKSVCVIHHQFWRGFPTLNGRDGFFFLEKNVAATCEKLRTVNPSGNGLRHGLHKQSVPCTVNQRLALNIIHLNLVVLKNMCF